MNKIHKLNSLLIDKIAAGEVINRPSSVLKELIENSIDAESTKINIIIEKGGHDLIQVSDDGCGINQNDLKLAFTRHATSKIQNIDDLNNINTLGFRGEALPSIASISKCSLQSATKENESFEIKIHGGDVISVTPTAGIKGSTIKIKHLFYNTPARRKFLKKPETEQASINKILRTFMLSYPKISFIMTSNKKTIYNVSKQNLQERIESIYGSINNKNLIYVNNIKEPYHVSGYTGDLSILKKRPGEQYIFLNGRYIQNKQLNSAIYTSYKSLIKRGEYPFYVLFIEMPSNLFDINVHPSKLEVRFKNDWQAYHVLKSSITKVLQDILSIIPNYKTYDLNENNYQINSRSIPFPTNKSTDSYRLDISPHKNTLDTVNSNISFDTEKINIANNRVKQIDDSNNSFHTLESTTEHIWQIHNKYLITEIKSGLIIIDQHVAHERILYEEAKNAMEHSGFPSQSVLFPQTIKFQPEEYEILVKLTHYLEKIGFRFREFGENTIIIEGLPPDLKWGNEGQIIREIIDQYISLKITESSFIDSIAAIYSCKSAIKAGDPLKDVERKHLVDRLFSTQHPYYCPHGRPVIINLSIKDLDHRFERH